MSNIYSFLKGVYNININKIDVLVYKNFKLLSAMFVLKTEYSCFCITLARKNKEVIRLINFGFETFHLIMLQGVLLSNHQIEQNSKQTNPI